MNTARILGLLMAGILMAAGAVLAAEPTAGQPKPQPSALDRPAQARPPAWAAKGAYVFRVSTPDEADMLPRLEEGHAIVAHLLDGTVPQITIVNGLIGHDHPGAWNWDGLWPYWNRVTFRAGSFEKLAAFMARAKEQLERPHRVSPQPDRREHRPARLPGIPRVLPEAGRRPGRSTAAIGTRPRTNAMARRSSRGRSTNTRRSRSSRIRCRSSRW